MSDDRDPVEDLSDEELYQELRKYKPDVGPIVDSTRGLYRKLLRRSIDPNTVIPAIVHPSPNSSSESNGSEEFELLTGEQDQVMTVPSSASPSSFTAPTASSSRQTRQSTTSRGRMPGDGGGGGSPIISQPSSPTMQSSISADPGSGLKKRRKDLRVSFDNNVEWVQNDPDDGMEPRTGWSFFLKALLIIAGLSILLSIGINMWADWMQELPTLRIASETPPVVQVTTPTPKVDQFTFSGSEKQEPIING